MEFAQRRSAARPLHQLSGDTAVELTAPREDLFLYKFAWEMCKLIDVAESVSAAGSRLSQTHPRRDARSGCCCCCIAVDHSQSLRCRASGAALQACVGVNALVRAEGWGQPRQQQHGALCRLVHVDSAEDPARRCLLSDLR
ncbi:unnamed protein product [Lampetra fluviatilis]